jgi:GMP synthase-like glutamine amidotransferase
MILIVDMNSKKDSLGFYEFVLPIVAVTKSHDEFVVRHFSEINREQRGNCRKIILSGTALKDVEFLKHVKDFDWIKKSSKPILGICAGMQTISLVFNSRLKECLEIGMREIRTVKENPLFSSTFKAYELHNYSIQASKEFEVLARGEKCVQAVKLRERDVYGVLFHPEVRNREIIERFILLQ